MTLLLLEITEATEHVENKEHQTTQFVQSRRPETLCVLGRLCHLEAATDQSHHCGVLLRLSDETTSTLIDCWWSESDTDY